jgi:hypothetical protein
MPVPSAISDLSQTAASNSPAGSESPTTLDDYQRAHASFIALLRDGKGFTTEATVASAATADIGAANSLFVQITGTTTITSFGTTYNGPRFLRFAAALTLTHGAALILPGSANILTAAGDTCIVVPEAAAWRVVSYQPAVYGVTGTVVGRSYTEYTTNADLTTIIPGDDTIPQNTEGTQIISVSYTPKTTTNRLRLRFKGHFSCNGAGLSGIAALFSSASANALRATLSTVTTSGYVLPLTLEYEYVPATTSAITFSVRAGPISAGAMRINGNMTSRLFGGTSGATLVIEEIAA